jgi:hypothetical protein
MTVPADTETAPVAPSTDGTNIKPAAALPMLATLAVAPPAAEKAPLAHADPVPNTFPGMTTGITAKSAAIEPSGSIVGAIPLPKPKPQVIVARVTRLVPLPRSRPAEGGPPPQSSRD